MSKTPAKPAPINAMSDPGAGVAAMIRLADQAREEMRLDEARKAYEQVLRLKPGHLDASIGLMRVNFYSKAWAAAWRDFEVRFRVMNAPPKVTGRDASGAIVDKPRWTGGPPPQKLLVLDEQGMGDTIQFLRFLPPLITAGTKVTLVTHRRLFQLIRSAGLDIELKPMDEPGSVTGITAWTPLLSLPMALGAGEAEATMKAPYLRPDPARVARWKEWLGAGGFSIGVAWRGNPKAPVDAGRSAPLAALAPLAAIPGVRLVSLQRQEGAESLDSAPFGRLIRVPGPEFDAGADAFVDTAALMMSLDLIVTVDTAVAHVAGALGRPLAIALQSRDADWRWIPGQERSMWYPTARLFRQPAQGDWFGCVARISEEVRASLRRGAERGAPNAPVSIGELIDKITILEIKNRKFPDGPKRENVRRELTALAEALRAQRIANPKVAELHKALRAVNETLWTIEDDIRECEARKDFGEKFIALARSVYVTNDRRAALKSEINTLAGSLLREEKSYASS